MLDHRDKIYDSLGLLADSLVTLVAADAIAIIRGVAVAAGAGIIDTGGGFTDGNLVIDIAANVEGWSNNTNDAGTGTTGVEQRMAFVLQGSTTTTFATQSPLLQLSFGVASKNAATIYHNFPNATFAFATADMAGARRFVKPFNNTYENKIYRWLRLYTAFTGTWGTGINYKAFLTK